MKIYLVFFLSAVFLSACGSSKPSHYYTLTSVHTVTGISKNNAVNSNIAVGIRTLTLPDYLLRPQMVKRTTTNELQIAEYDRWAEPLENNFSRVLIEDLSSDIPTNNIALFPSETPAITNFQVLLEVTEFERNAGGTLTMTARWGVAKGEAINFLMDKRTSYTEQVSGDKFEEIAAAMSKLTGKLSEDIAAEIRTRAGVRK